MGMMRQKITLRQIVHATNAVTVPSFTGALIHHKIISRNADGKYRVIDRRFGNPKTIRNSRLSIEFWSDKVTELLGAVGLNSTNSDCILCTRCYIVKDIDAFPRGKGACKMCLKKDYKRKTKSKTNNRIKKIPKYLLERGL